MEIVIAPVTAEGAVQFGRFACRSALPENVERLEIGDRGCLIRTCIPQTNDPFHDRKVAELREFHGAGKGGFWDPANGEDAAVFHPAMHPV